MAQYETHRDSLGSDFAAPMRSAARGGACEPHSRFFGRLAQIRLNGALALADKRDWYGGAAALQDLPVTQTLMVAKRWHGTRLRRIPGPFGICHRGGAHAGQWGRPGGSGSCDRGDAHLCWCGIHCRRNRPMDGCRIGPPAGSRRVANQFFIDDRINARKRFSGRCAPSELAFPAIEYAGSREPHLNT